MGGLCAFYFGPCSCAKFLSFRFLLLAVVLVCARRSQLAAKTALSAGRLAGQSRPQVALPFGKLRPVWRAHFGRPKANKARAQARLIALAAELASTAPLLWAAQFGAALATCHKVALMGRARIYSARMRPDSAPTPNTRRPFGSNGRHFRPGAGETKLARINGC